MRLFRLVTMQEKGLDVKRKRYLRLAVYPLVGSLAVSANAPPHDQGGAPGTHQSEFHAVLPPHPADDHPESPDRNPLPQLRIAVTTSTSAYGIVALGADRDTADTSD